MRVYIEKFGDFINIPDDIIESLLTEQIYKEFFKDEKNIFVSIESMMKEFYLTDSAAERYEEELKQEVNNLAERGEFDFD